MLPAIAAPVPAELLPVDNLLTRYGRWATTSSRGGRPATLDREFRPEMDRHESYAHWVERCSRIPRDPLMPTPEAMRVQRALGQLPTDQRVVLAALYVPQRRPAERVLALAGVTPAESCARHLAGLRKLSTVLAAR